MARNSREASGRAGAARETEGRPGEPLFHCLADGGRDAHFTVHVVNHRPGLPSGTTMADLAAVYAQAIRGISEGPVNMLAISTGGSIALQLAADHPGLVDRLVLAGTACTLGPTGRRAQRAYIEPVHDIKAVTLLIQGDRDLVCPLALARQTVEGIPDAQLVVYPGRSHSGTFTDKRFAPDALAFLTDS
ncbi:alpha/beta fold hydrolase [Nonomuraea sp. CA-218870]|uniref:alpha/beta fold hydrolase n=1 Tax=Nonomuraea sp. CA-218870 TaxID=3239998 RepID=UPI003D8B78DA